jgi:alanine racemase
MTHFATADDDQAFVAEQLAAFLPWADTIAARHPGVIRHAANSAATLAAPDSRLDLVRCGIAIYGMDPFQRDPGELEPALELVSYLAEVKRAAPGQSAGYGRTWIAERETWVGTVPVGYGDGVRRGLGNRIQVLVDGKSVPLVGTVSMDNVTVDLGPGEPPDRGAEVVLLGTRGRERILAEDWARALGTINYEITCGLSPRVPRHPS